MENETYLRKHPEVECLVAGFLRSVCIFIYLIRFGVHAPLSS